MRSLILLFFSHNLDTYTCTDTHINTSTSRRHRIQTLASGDLTEQVKFFLYSQDVDGNVYLVQAIITKPTRTLDVLLKTDATPTTCDPVEAFMDKLAQALGSIQLI